MGRIDQPAHPGANTAAWHLCEVRSQGIFPAGAAMFRNDDEHAGAYGLGIAPGAFTVLSAHLDDERGQPGRPASSS